MQLIDLAETIIGDGYHLSVDREKAIECLADFLHKHVTELNYDAMGGYIELRVLFHWDGSISSEKLHTHTQSLSSVSTESNTFSESFDKKLTEMISSSFAKDLDASISSTIAKSNKTQPKPKKSEQDISRFKGFLKNED